MTVCIIILHVLTNTCSLLPSVEMAEQNTAVLKFIEYNSNGLCLSVFLVFLSRCGIRTSKQHALFSFSYLN